MHAKLRFFCFRPEISFLKKFDPKITTVSLSWNLVSRLIRIFRNSKFHGDVYFFHYPPEKPFLSKFDSNIQNCQFKLKPGTQTNSSNQDSMVMFIYSVLDRKYPFWAKLIPNFKIVSLSWNLVSRLIRICRIQWRYSLFLFETGNTLFWQIWYLN